jgi:TonB family protein
LITVLPAKFLALLVILVTCVAPSPAWCQKSNVANQLESEFKGKTLLLRGFYLGDELEYDQNGALHGTAMQGSWTLANVEIKKIAVTAQGIAIVGNRKGTFFRDGKPNLGNVGKLNIHVTKLNSDADDEATLHQLLSKIFMEPSEDLRPLVPVYWQTYFAGGDSKSRIAAWKAAVPEDINRVSTKSDPAGLGVKPPKVVYQKEPDYTKEAALIHTEGVSHLGTIIDNTGKPGNIVILEPLGMGLDEQAILALSQWKFQPAMKGGQPVPVQIVLEMDFRCCF